MNNFTDELRQHNLKATPQRLAISDALYKYGHINIDDLYLLMLKNFHSISLATIYKNINLMIENSFIQEVKVPKEKSVYELTKDIHYHLLCSTCKEIEDIFIDIQTIHTQVKTKSNFEISKTDLVLSGTCKNCQ